MDISTVNLLIIIGAVVIVIGLIILALAKQYRKVGPNEVLIISGGRMRKVTDPDGTVKKIGYRMSIGGGTFVKPFIEQVQVLPLVAIHMSRTACDTFARVKENWSRQLNQSKCLRGCLS